MPLWLLGIAFALVGVPMVWIAMRVFARDAAIRKWPRAPGKVVASHVGAHSDHYRHEDGHAYTTTVYQPGVRYTYVVGGVTREGSSIARAIDGATIGERAARRLIDRYPAGREVGVLYDPEDPTRAHLEVKRSVGAVVLCAFGALWMALGLLLLVLSYTL